MSILTRTCPFEKDGKVYVINMKWQFCKYCLNNKEGSRLTRKNSETHCQNCQTRLSIVEEVADLTGPVNSQAPKQLSLGFYAVRTPQGQSKLVACEDAQDYRAKYIRVDQIEKLKTP